MSVFITSIEVFPLPGCTLISDARGAFVRSFVCADDAQSAVDTVVEHLSGELVQINEDEVLCAPIGEFQWDPGEREAAEEFIQEAQTLDQVVLWQIFTWNEE